MSPLRLLVSGSFWPIYHLVSQMLSTEAAHHEVICRGVTRQLKRVKQRIHTEGTTAHSQHYTISLGMSAFVPLLIPCTLLIRICMPIFLYTLTPISLSPHNLGT